MLAVGRAVRATVIRPGRIWRIPYGLGRGLRVEIDAHAPLHTYVGTAELEIARYIKYFARTGSRCFDVGGHDGYYAMALARLTGAEVISFEFDEACVVRMRRNLALNPQLACQISIVQTYVAHERVQSPPADTLDRLIEAGHVFVPDVIKIDVEGAEASVLSGADKLLRGRQPHLVVETHSVSLEGQCIELLESVGYSPMIVDQRRRLRENRGNGQNRWIIAEGRESDVG
jgi:FkbM family methyltransferase